MAGNIFAFDLFVINMSNEMVKSTDAGHCADRVFVIIFNHAGWVTISSPMASS